MLSSYYMTLIARERERELDEKIKKHVRVEMVLEELKAEKAAARANRRPRKAVFRRRHA